MLLEIELIVRPRNKSGKEGRGHHQDDLHRPSDRPTETSGCDENNAQNLHFSKQFRVDFFREMAILRVFGVFGGRHHG